MKLRYLRKRLASAKLASFFPSLHHSVPPLCSSLNLCQCHLEFSHHKLKGGNSFLESVGLFLISTSSLLDDDLLEGELLVNLLDDLVNLFESRVPLDGALVVI